MRIAPRRVVVACLTMLVGLSTAQAENPEFGPVTTVSPFGFSQLDGTSSWHAFFQPINVRRVRYAVSQIQQAWGDEKRMTALIGRYRTFSGSKTKTGGTSSIAGIELIGGYAYVQIEDSDLTMVHQPEEMAIEVIADFERYRAPMTWGLVNRGLIGRIDPRRFVPRLEDASLTLEANPALLAAIEAAAAGVDLARDAGSSVNAALVRAQWDRFQNESTQDLAAMIMTAAEGDDEAPVAAAVLFAMAIGADPELKDFLGMVRYPFIISNRTVGGAASTDIVTYATEPEGDALTVYYFYVKTESEDVHPIEVAAESLSTSTPMATPVDVAVEYFATLPMTQQTYDGKTDWFLNGAIMVQPINAATVTDDALDALQAAWNDACIAGLVSGSLTINDITLDACTEADP